MKTIESFEMKIVNRALINNAPYNPRTITEEASKKLKKSLKKFGLISPLTVNKRTMNLVGGHQRLFILDSIHKKNDYNLNVCMCDLDEMQEKEANILLNNQNAAGDWDSEKLNELFSEGIEFEEVGFDLNDLNLMEIETSDFLKQEENETVKKDLEAIEKIKAIRKEFRDKKIPNRLRKII